MFQKIYSEKILLIIPVLIILFIMDTGCKKESSPTDNMEIMRKDAEYIILLNGNDIAHFSIPAIIDTGYPEIDIKEMENNWYRVSMSWEVQRESDQDELVEPRLNSK